MVEIQFQSTLEQYPDHKWLAATIVAVPVTVFLLALHYYWFAVADRYAVFLYSHLEAGPFDPITISRYWMTGFVASGFVLLLYNTAVLLIGVSAHGHGGRKDPPAWPRIWIVAALPVAAGTYWIITTRNHPVLPPAIAVAVVVATLVGLALALMPAAIAARDPMRLLWLGLLGLGLTPILILFRAVESLPDISLSAPILLGILAIAWLGGLAWSLIVNYYRRSLHDGPIVAHEIWIAGLCWSYLIMPVAHHLFATPPAYRYITAAANFLSASIGFQTAVLLFAWIQAWLIGRVSIQPWFRGGRHRG